MEEESGIIQNEVKTSFNERLLNAQKEFETINKSSDNPYFKSKYADLNEIIKSVTPGLNKHGLSLTQPIIDGIVYTIVSDGVTSIQSGLKLPSLSKPQELGSCITYYRRYTLSSLLGLGAEDDDGNLASKPKPKINDVQFQKVLKGDKEMALEYLEKADLTPEQVNQLKYKHNL